MLSTTVEPHPSAQRLIDDKICNVILDSGSSENFITKKFVAALNLKVEPHPSAHKIGWVKKGGEVHVNEICIVPLTIGNRYKDQIICGVLEMDVSHSFGETVNARALHKGRENTYEFQCMDKKIVLLPLAKKDDESVNSTKKRSNHLFTTINGKKLLKERRH